MSPLRQTAALLVVITIFTSVAGIPRPEETNNEIDNIIPQVGGKSVCRYSKPRFTQWMCSFFADEKRKDFSFREPVLLKFCVLLCM
jgi:hypothetical protein